MNKNKTEEFNKKKEAINKKATVSTGASNLSSNKGDKKKAIKRKTITTNQDQTKVAFGKEALKLIIKAGVHLGHYEAHPKMRPQLTGNRKNRKILNLKLSFKMLQYSKILVDEIYKKGGTILFVCTKPGLSQMIKPMVPKNNRILFINHKWLGGTLTNWNEIIKQTFDMKMNNKINSLSEEKKSKAKRFSKLFSPFLSLFPVNSTEDNGPSLNISPQVSQDRDNSNDTLKIKAPSLIVLFHGSDQIIPLREAKKTRTPVIAVVDSDANPQDIFYPIPGNDDSFRSQYLQARTLFHGIPSSNKK